MNNRPMRGGFYSADEALRNFFAKQGDAARERRVANSKEAAARQGREADPEIANNPGMVEAVMRTLQQDNRQGMAARGAIVGTPITASGAGLISLMQFLAGGREQQVEREGVLTS